MSHGCPAKTTFIKGGNLCLTIVHHSVVSSIKDVIISQYHKFLESNFRLLMSDLDQIYSESTQQSLAVSELGKVI
jgi:hypothetical protein